MLKKITIRNFALIDSLEVKFEKSFNIITGETGSGKSIMLGALSLVLGGRADISSIADSSKKCVIECVFGIGDRKLKRFFTESDLDYAEDTIIRREILPSGKSRAFINDTPVNLQQLKSLGLHLIDIHSQHQTLLLGEENFRFSVLDGYAGVNRELEKYQEAFKEYQHKKRELVQLKEKEAQSKLDMDYHRFLFSELEEAGLKEEEHALLEQKQQRLQNSESISEGIDLASQAFSFEGNNILSLLKDAEKALRNIEEFDEEIQKIGERVVSSRIELEDVAAELEEKKEGELYDPEELYTLSNRLNVLNTLMHKHQVDELKDLIAIKEQLEEKINNVDHLGDAIVETENGLAVLKSELLVIGGKISEKRKNSIKGLEKSVFKILTQLSMGGAALSLKVEAREEPGERGIDDLKFLFKTNEGGSFQEAAKIASGGELSRLMLALKSLLAGKLGLGTVIFDEIDTGVSGEVAHQMGNIMSDMAKRVQVISITHLPQVAGKGDAHYKVYKQKEGNKVQTSILQLNQNDRLNELAKMLSGANLTQEALNNAKTLLKD